VGASSAIAQDFLREANRRASEDTYHLYSRDYKFLDALEIEKIQYFIHDIGALRAANSCDVVINFVGLGSPARIARESQNLLTLDQDIDASCMRLLSTNPNATYLYLSSGASYGNNFFEPASDSNELPSLSSFDLPRDNYGWTKRCAEVRHRALPDFKIVNLRIFGYVSRYLDRESGFLLSDLAKSIETGQPVNLTNSITRRDFISSKYFYELVEFCVEQNLPNISLDLVSAAPLEKRELVEQFVNEYGLKVIWSDDQPQGNSNSKENYFSISSRLQNLGFAWGETALEMVLSEFEARFRS
jgi:hypothetical protein